MYYSQNIYSWNVSFFVTVDQKIVLCDIKYLKQNKAFLISIRLIIITCMHFLLLELPSFVTYQLYLHLLAIQLIVLKGNLSIKMYS